MNYNKLTDAEIDEAVAEKVMGWKRDCGKRGDTAIQTWRRQDGRHKITWLPSSELDDAFEVVEAMRERGECFMLLEDRYNGSYSGGKWIAYFGTNPDRVADGVWNGDPECMTFWSNPPHKCAAAGTPSRAICVAALRAVGTD